MIHSRAFRAFDPTERLYCSVAAAVLGGSALGAGASIWGSNKAVDAQTAASTASIANQKDMFNTNKNLLTPFINAGAGDIPGLQDWLNTSGGESGNNPLSALLKLVTPGADMSDVLSKTPGFQFSQNQGTRAALNALAARGLGGSPGAIAKGVGGYVTGLAGNTWDSVVKNLLSTFQTGGGMMQNFVNSGINAGGALTGVGSKTADSISGAITGAGNAQAAGANAAGSAISGMGGSLTTAALIKQLTSGGGNSIYGGSPSGSPGFGNFGELSPYSPMNAIG